MKAASFVILLAAGLAVGLPVSGAAPAAGSRAAVEPRDGYYYAAGRSSHLASVAAGKLAFSFVPAKCAPPGAVRQAAGTLAISGTGTFAFNGGVVGSTGIATISGRFVDATTLVATITFRTVYGGSECTSKATVTYRWGAPAPVKPKPKSPPATKKPPRVPRVEELDCKYPQVAALVTPNGAVLPPEYADKKPAGARAVCWPSVRVYTGSLTATRTASGQTAYRSKSEMEKAISSGTYKLSHAEVSLGGAPEAVYRATVNVVGTVTGQSHEPMEDCTWSGSGHVPGISTITIRIGPRAKPLVTHQVETPGSKLEQNFQCTRDRGSGTVDDPGLAGVATAWTPVRTWQTLAGSETRQGSIYGFEGLIQLPATTTITWSFKAMS